MFRLTIWMSSYSQHKKDHHSVETVLVKVFDDLICAVDSTKMMIMTLLELSMAFGPYNSDVQAREVF